jgi:membrane-bound lytic murein transglycosylase D
MNLKKITLIVSLLIAGNTFAQSFSMNSVRSQSSKTYLDSIKKTFVNDNIASCVDSLWLKELTSLDLYNDLEKDIKTINLG